ncbi:MAG TPA: hypothetical protein VK601_12710 [Kofleriaceae bacterium]|nr:hypothetical protein [Kofleriaceae bacterium]
MHHGYLWIAIGLAACGGAAHPDGGRVNVPTGVWQREWIRRHGGAPDHSVAVRYVQTPSVFGDLRIRDSRPDLASATSLADLSDDQLGQLARQNGFAGVTTMAGANATWHHEIDFQPGDGSPDVGRIEAAGEGAMLEHALDDAYVERWTFVPRTAGPEAGAFAVRVVRDERTTQLLAVAGQRFVYARARSHPLPAGESLTELIARNHPGRDALLAWLDCEISYGAAHDWRIESSTLPWLQGKRLVFADLLAIGADGRPFARAPSPGEQWSFPVDTLPPDERLAMFGPHTP